MSVATLETRARSVAGHGLRLHALEWSGPAKPPPVVLLHGIGGLASDWHAVGSRLAERRRVIAIEARGHGLSEWCPDADYSTDAHFADLVTALDDLGVERCVLAGFSMGGGVAMLAAHALGERVAALAVVDAYPAPGMTPGSRRIAERLADYAPARADRPRFDPAISAAFARDLAAGDARRMDLWPHWDALECPTLLVRGRSSSVLPGALAAEMCARQRRARLEVLDTGHGIPFTHPGELAALLAAI